MYTHIKGKHQNQLQIQANTAFENINKSEETADKTQCEVNQAKPKTYLMNTLETMDKSDERRIINVSSVAAR